MSEIDTLMDAAKAGDVTRVRAILREHPQLASARLPSGESPLMAALYRGQREVVAAIVEAGGEVDIFAAAATGRTAELHQALKDPAKLNAFAYDGWTPLHLAAFFGHVDTARALVEAGADVHAFSQNSLRNTPLHAATAGKHSEVALFLLAAGADAQAVDGGGYTPVRIASENGLDAVVRAAGAASRGSS
jgi:ankyrin repeat protein